jgi:hypothetical protein
MIVVAQTEQGVLLSQALNTVDAIKIAEINGVYIGNVMTYQFKGEEKIFNELIALLNNKRVSDYQFKVSSATYQFILDKLNDNI